MSEFTIVHNGKTYANFTAQGLKAKGIPETVIDAALADKRLIAVKAECRRRIYGQASQETQMNMATATAAIAGKAVADRSAEEVTLLTSTKAALDWVGAMRARCPDLAADPDADFKLGASWPECPPEVVALTEQF
ncbi:hypothetical protein [Pseudovibrio ascidiaceicola]|uniref:hypothetical protein n=1 Tax=Pseudovibrio ascidiaceicola TaxID=285279 RepID=UPI000D699019|nr:hypothetical protein [Pseudovibrio ascidiaceicola]